MFIFKIYFKYILNLKTKHENSFLITLLYTNIGFHKPFKSKIYRHSGFKQISTAYTHSFLYLNTFRLSIELD